MDWNVAGMENIRIIAHIYTDFDEKFGIPRQSGIVKQCRGRIVFEPEYRNEEALAGIDGYSHLWLIWKFSESVRQEWSPTVRPPRLGGNKRVACSRHVRRSDLILWDCPVYGLRRLLPIVPMDRSLSYPGLICLTKLLFTISSHICHTPIRTLRLCAALRMRLRITGLRL